MTDESPIPASLRRRTVWGLRCPQCGKGKLLSGLLSLRDACPVCGHDFTGYAGADGPAYIAIVLVSTIVMILAVWLDLKYEPPLWVHALLWIPLTAILSLLFLRHAKGWIVAAHYAHAIREPANIDETRRQYQGDSFQ